MAIFSPSQFWGFHPPQAPAAHNLCSNAMSCFKSSGHGITQLSVMIEFQVKVILQIIKNPGNNI